MLKFGGKLDLGLFKRGRDGSVLRDTTQGADIIRLFLILLPFIQELRFELIDCCVVQ